MRGSGRGRQRRRRLRRFSSVQSRPTQPLPAPASQPPAPRTSPATAEPEVVSAARRGRQVAAIDTRTCTGCGRCIAACPAQAIALGPDRKARVNANLCRGCAVCASECPVGAISMVAAETSA